MYYRNTSHDKETNFKPFTIICNNCGSHDVTATACEYLDLEIKCNCCGSYVDVGRYTEHKYHA